MKLPSSLTVFSHLTRMNSGPFQVELMHERRKAPEALSMGMWDAGWFLSISYSVKIEDLELYPYQN